MEIAIKHSCEDFTTYRAERVKSMFNAESGANWSKTVKLDLPDGWGVGLVVGKSGSGKTSLGKKIFGANKIYNPYSGWDKTKPIIDGIAPDGSFDDVTSALSSVGLGDVPSWLRPFTALSNGQKFRAGLARLICESPNQIVVDEFTSVVDRQIAKIGAQAFGKSWRRNCEGKQVVLLSCHYDVIEWLQPDWVYNMDTGELKKKVQSAHDQKSNLMFGRSTEVIGKCLRSITI